MLRAVSYGFHVHHFAEEIQAQEVAVLRWTCLQVSAKRSHCGGVITLFMSASCTMLAAKGSGRLDQPASVG